MIRNLLRSIGSVSAAALLLAAAPLDVAAQNARVEVSLDARQVSLYRGGERAQTWRIGVGQPEWPVKQGEWKIYQIDFNPDWNPPRDESWTEGHEATSPGHPDNPMGRVRMRYDPPRSIHGTDDTESIGKAESHGSIRIRNSDGLELARLLMEASGDTRSESWWNRVRENETTMYTVKLSNPVPIRVQQQ